jgi:YD repeat-containing protein
MRHSNIRAAATAALLTTTMLSAPALAQSTPNPFYRNWDENNVDVVRGDYHFNFEEASIGSGKARLAIIRQGAGYFSSQWEGRRLTRSGVSPTIHTKAKKPDGSYFNFTNSTSDAGDGATLVLTQDPVTFNAAYEITDHDGVKYLYSDPVGTDAGLTNYCSGSVNTNCDDPISRITYPDGTLITFTNRTWSVGLNQWSDRLSSVANNFGYSIVFTYPSLTDYNKTKSTLKFNGVQQAVVNYAYPVNGTVDVTDPAGQVWEFTAFSIKKPGEATPGFTVTAPSGIVTSVTNAGVTTTYNRVANGNTITLTKTDPLGKATVITSDLTFSRVTSVKDPLNRTTTYGYDTSGRLTSVTNPEGDGIDYVLDARGNASQIKQRPKTGSGSPLLITTQTFPGTCTNPITPATSRRRSRTPRTTPPITPMTRRMAACSRSRSRRRPRAQSVRRRDSPTR